MKRTILALALGVVAGSGVSVAAAGAHTEPVLPARVIDSIHGSTSTGFQIVYGDGTGVEVPPLAVVQADCGEGVGPQMAAHCRGLARGQYQMMSEMRNTLNAKRVNR